MVGVVFDGGHFLASNVRRLDLIRSSFATLGLIQRQRGNRQPWKLALSDTKADRANVSF